MGERHRDRLFFRSSRAFASSITELFDFVWPTAAAMWNLRWQVRGYADTNPKATKEEIDGRFVVGSGIPSTNLRRSCLEWTWEQQKEVFAKFLLLDAVALYEGWIKATLTSLCVTDDAYEKGLQFPTGVYKGRATGVGPTLALLTTPESPVLKKALYPGLKSHYKNSAGELENLFQAFRFFKESRNDLVHNGGLAQAATVAACGVLGGFKAVDLGMTEAPAHHPVALNTPIRLKLRGIVSLCDIVLRLVVTLDAELARAQSAEEEFCERWRQGQVTFLTLKTRDDKKRAAQVSAAIHKVGFPRPAETEELARFLRDRKLVH